MEKCKVINVPQEFQSPILVEYPKHNKIIFEQWLINNIGHFESTRYYLPINWCGFFVNHRYGSDKSAMSRLNKYLRTLDKSKKYWTVTQYDLGIIADISGIDVLVFGSGGGHFNVAIPLVCAPHGRIENEKTIGFSFIGSLTHPIRNELMNSSIQHESKMRSYMMYNRHHDIDLYCEVMSKSTFSICPRGFGFSSFRICESLEQGAIPVYISDEFIFPEGQKAFEEYGVVIHRDEIQNIKSILESLTPEQIKYKQDAGRIAYQELYTFDGLRKWILNNI